MNKVILSLTALCFSVGAFAQPSLSNFYIGGFQTTTMKIQDRGNNGIDKFGNFTLSGLSVNERIVFHTDVTYLAGALIGGETMQGGVFEAGLGTPFAKKDNSMWGWSADLMFRNARTDQFKYESNADVVNEEINFAGVGASIYNVRTIAGAVYIMPKLSLAYGGSNWGDKRPTMGDASITLGVPLSDAGWGVSTTLGSYGMNWDYDDDTSTKLSVNYWRIGLAKLLN